MGDILFLTHRVPWPPNRGDKIRSHHILRKLMEFAPVHLACFADDEAEAAETSDLQNGLTSCHIVRRTKPQWMAGIEALVSGKSISVTSFGSKQLQNWIGGLINHGNVDCIFVFSGQMAQYIPDSFSGRVIMDFADVDSAKFESYGDEGYWPMSWINKREGRLLKAFEYKTGARSDKSLFVSTAEAQLFQQRSGLSTAKIMALGNGIDLEFYRPEVVETTKLGGAGPLLVFTGQMDYRPNIEAVASFSKHVMPKILVHFPDTQFAIVGRAPTEAVWGLDGKNGTQVVGAVDDIRTWLKAADVVVAPLRIARGIQNKILEAMAMGKPVVASGDAAEGIDAIHGQHFLVAENIQQEASLICNLLEDPTEADWLGSNAAKLVRDQYSWEHQLFELPGICGLDDHQFAEAAE
ncbi:TIGR03087 family PEP-CTERM/XrtA system glycosyltransferase [Parasphingorhabdus halotolerans]|nr:TIGR03087 family PEP-CTERM/XrtA system glycosyltransferase [Parasphingorhabdus halotolerans]